MTIIHIRIEIPDRKEENCKNTQDGYRVQILSFYMHCKKVVFGVIVQKKTKPILLNIHGNCWKALLLKDDNKENVTFFLVEMCLSWVCNTGVSHTRLHPPLNIATIPKSPLYSP